MSSSSSKRSRRERHEARLVAAANRLASKLDVYYDTAVPRLYRGGCTKSFKDEFDKTPQSRPGPPDSPIDYSLSKHTSEPPLAPQNRSSPFWSCFASLHLRTCIDGFYATDAIESNYSMALGSVNTSPYFRMWSRIDPDGLEGLLIKQAERTAAVDVTKDPQKFQLGCSMLGILVVECTSDPRSFIPSHIHTKIVSSLSWCRTPPRSLPGNPLAIHMLDGLISVLSSSPSPNAGTWRCSLESCTRREDDGGSDLLRCSRCRSELYCSTEHQKLDWSRHRLYCFENDLF